MQGDLRGVRESDERERERESGAQGGEGASQAYWVTGVLWLRQGAIYTSMSVSENLGATRRSCKAMIR